MSGITPKEAGKTAAITDIREAGFTRGTRKQLAMLGVSVAVASGLAAYYIYPQLWNAEPVDCGPGGCEDNDGYANVYGWPAAAGVLNFAASLGATKLMPRFPIVGWLSSKLGNAASSGLACFTNGTDEAKAKLAQGAHYAAAAATTAILPAVISQVACAGLGSVTGKVIYVFSTGNFAKAAGFGALANAGMGAVASCFSPTIPNLEPSTGSAPLLGSDDAPASSNDA